MNIEQLTAFLKEARERCGYESLGESGERELPDGTRVIGPYTNGALSYTDIYKGFEWFDGREEIRENNKLVWMRKYNGGIIDEQHREREKTINLYDILKSALRQFPRGRPFKRGPDHFQINDYEYFDECEGNMTFFSGRERILNNGRKVYFLNYGGGVM